MYNQWTAFILAAALTVFVCLCCACGYDTIKEVL